MEWERKVHVGGIVSGTTTEEQLFGAAMRFGEIEKVHLVDIGRPTTFAHAFITYKKMECAKTAIEIGIMHINGNPLQINEYCWRQNEITEETHAKLVQSLVEQNTELARTNIRLQNKVTQLETKQSELENRIDLLERQALRGPEQQPWVDPLLAEIFSSQDAVNNSNDLIDFSSPPKPIINGNNNTL